MGLRDRVQDLSIGIWMGGQLLAERVITGQTFNPTKRALRRDPFPFYRELRERDPFHRSFVGDGWVLSRYADIDAVLRDPRFSADERNLRRYPAMRRRRERAGLPDPYETGRASMLRTDAPDHTRLRSLVSKAFTGRAVESMKPRIEKTIDELLSGLRPGDPMDLISDFAAPLPVTIIAEMLGVPGEDRDRFRAWSDEAIQMLGDGPIEVQRRGVAAMEELGEYIEGVAEQRRAAPTDDLLSALVQAEEEGDRLSREELATTCVLLLVAGNETTTKLIANSILALSANPDQLELLRLEPKRIMGAVDELLRFDGPVQLTSRMVLEDQEWHGNRLRAGQQLILLLAAGNRDPEAFADPDRLDVTRENVRHLAFGRGTHFCLGAQLARLEGGMALEALIERFPSLRLGEGSIEWGSNTVLRGPLEVPLVL